MNQGVALAFGGSLDPAAWSRAHATGAVPDQLPYGLHRLSGHGLTVRDHSVAWSAGAPVALHRRVLRKVGSGFDWGLMLSRRPHADVLLSWDERPGAVLALRHGRRIPVVTNVIWLTDLPSLKAPGLRLAAAGLRRAAGLFVLSSAQVPLLTEIAGVARDRITAVPFGIDADFYAPAHVAGSSPDPDLVVSVGNDRHRDWPATLEAFELVRRNRPSARLVVVSATAPSPDLASAEGVEHIGDLDHVAVRALLARASVLLVMTSPNVHVSGITAALEAMALERPVVISQSPGLHDYGAADDGFIAVDDPHAAAEAVTDLLGDPAAARARGIAGRRAVVEHFSTEHQAARLATVLERALDRHQ